MGEGCEICGGTGWLGMLAMPGSKLPRYMVEQSYGNSLTFEDLIEHKSRSRSLNWAIAYHMPVTTGISADIELINMKRGKWTVMVYNTEKWKCPNGFNNTEIIDAYGKSYNNVDDAIRAINDILNNSA
jgi:hypothetical protein